jgi:hypothetical protein
MNAEQFDNEIRHRLQPDTTNDNDNNNEEQIKDKLNIKRRGKKTRRTYEQRIAKREGKLSINLSIFLTNTIIYQLY